MRFAIHKAGLTALLLCCFVRTAAGGPVAEAWAEPRFQAVGVGQIPRDVVPALAQDRDGFIWLATGDGLVRYDGHHFRPQERPSADPARRNLGWIPALLAGRDGRLWIGTEADGLASYDPRSDRVTDHRSGQAGGALPAITALAEDAEGRIWVGTAGAGLEHHDPDRGVSTPYRQDGRPGGLPDDRVSALHVDREGTLWVGTWRGLSRRSRGAAAFEPVALQAPRQDRAAAADTVTALLQASDGSLWVGMQQGRVLIVDPSTQGVREVGVPGAAVTSLAETPGEVIWVGRRSGIDLHDARDGRWQRTLRHDPRRYHGLAGNEVTALLMDRAGSIWVAGYGLGLQRHEPGNQALRLRGADLLPGSALAPADVRALLQRRKGEIWAALHRGGVVRMDPALQVTGSIEPRDGQGRLLRVNALHEAAGGSLWLGSEGEVQELDAGLRPLRRLPHPGGQTHALLQAADGTLWVGTQDGLFFLPAGAGSLRPAARADGRRLTGEVFVAARGADGGLWVGGAQGLFRIASGSRVLQAVDSDDGGAGLANPVVIGLLVDREGTLWVDTAVTGLHRLAQWDGQRAQFDRVSARHGIFNRPFGASLQQDAQGRIWTHMHVYDPRQDKLHELTAADGVIFGTGWFRSTASLADGRLLFGGSRGLLVVQPAQYRPERHPPPLQLTALRIDGVPQPFRRDGRGLTLQASQRSLSVEFAALDFTDAGRSRYAYRLEGFDRDWTNTGANLRVASYGNLTPGDYRLRVRASDRSGIWGPEELVLPLQVLPAWWQQPLARALAALGALLALLGLVEWRTRHLRGQRAALAVAVAERTAELEAERAALDERVQARTRELSAATAVAEAANQAKGVFLRSVSHDMRTPLNAIIGLTQLQLQATEDAQQRSRLAQVGAAARQLLGLVDHVLALSSRGPALRDAAPAAGAGAAAAAEAAATSAPETRHPQEPEPAPTPRFHGERVLLAEDEAVNQIVAAGILENAGLRVDVAENGAQAVRMAAATEYALILMDIRMPELDGLAATRAIRAAPGGREVPIVALSAFAFDEDRLGCLDAGMNAHLSKPVDTAVLLQAVQRWLRKPAA